MKKITFFVLLLISSTMFAQITNEGKPASWKLTENTKSFKTINLPKFDLEKLKTEDLINDKLLKPFRFGYKHKVNFGLNDGEWLKLKDGSKIWRIKFQSKGALSLNFIFDDFYLPKGSTLYLYNNDKSDLLGAYTSNNNNSNNSLGTWIIQGDTVWIEYFEPAKTIDKVKLHINTITHAYRNAQTAKDLKLLGDSGDCNQDVDCPIGTDWEVYRDNNKKAVALILNNGNDWCSGALINNTNNDETPYFLTANHCIDGQNTANWTFRFGWISPNPICASSANSDNGPTNMQINGAVVRASNTNSDFALLELNSTIPSTWDRTWVGWDNTDTNPTFEVGIHHPSGDIMKICRDNTGAIKNPNTIEGNTAQTWEITTAGGGWELGVTEGGSSGSPLFDQNGRLIGQLYGGGASCSGTSDNGQLDFYGRFGVSWNAIAGSTNQLQPWLDPANSGQTVLDSYPALVDYNLDVAISVTIPTLNCGESQINPFITIINNGTTTLTNATIQWNLDGGTNETINWTGSLVQNASENINLPTTNLTVDTHTLSVTLNDVNGVTDENVNNNTASTDVIIAIFNTTQIHLELQPDNYGSETSWEFKDESGTILYSGGPYTDDDNTIINESFNVPTSQCYSFEMLDSYGDGMCCTYGDGYYTLKTDNDTLIFSGGGFESSEITEIAIGSTANTNDILSKSITIYPNPTNNYLNVHLNNVSGEYKYTLVNTLGQLVLQGNLLNTNNILNVSNIDKGIYFLKIEDKLSDNSMVEKIIIK